MTNANQEQQDAMNDTAFCDYWDARVEHAQANATSQDEVDAVVAQRDEAHAARRA